MEMYNNVGIIYRAATASEVAEIRHLRNSHSEIFLDESSVVVRSVEVDGSGRKGNSRNISLVARYDAFCPGISLKRNQLWKIFSRKEDGRTNQSLKFARDNGFVGGSERIDEGIEDLSRQKGLIAQRYDRRLDGFLQDRDSCSN